MTKKIIKLIESSEPFLRWSVTGSGRKDGYVYYKELGREGKIHHDDYIIEVLGSLCICRISHKFLDCPIHGEPNS